MTDDTYNYIYDAMCQCLDLLDDLSNPDYDKQYKKLDKAIEKFYNWYNEGNYALEPQHIGFTIEVQTSKGKFYGYVAEHQEETGLPYYSEEPDDAIIFETMQDAQNWIDTNSEGTDFNFIIINKKD